MWPGQQPPGGEQNPQDPNQNPYQQPGYQQQNPYTQPGYQQQPGTQQQPGAQPQGPWNAPTTPMGAVAKPPGDDRKKTTIIAIVAATAVVAAAGVTGYLVLGGDDDDKSDTAKPKDDPKPSATAPKDPTPEASPTESEEEENPRGTEDLKPQIKGWKVVVNPKHGTAFDVPADWEIDSPGMITGYEKTDAKAGDKPLIVMSAPAYYKSEWCGDDPDKDGKTDYTRLAATGTKGANGAKSTADAAEKQVPWWVYGGYTQPDKKSITYDKKAKPYTTTAGIKGSYAWARSKDTPQNGKCDTDGKAIVFGFKNAKGDYVAWSLHGATGVDDELPDKDIMKIMSTVRLADQDSDDSE
ncbi:hypothetical protein [Streptomyces apocyni]|uniref:hypothetical protein n=1 Tax=Streptomyces apocyni TaxID=2654677 RepID=UPI0012EA4E18|nr:hypothetical protein [Streptomyces apocyni]